MSRSQEQWIEEYRRRGALWLHNGNPEQPHALLTSGNHSDGFFNSGLIVENPLILEEAAFDLSLKLVRAGLDLRHVERVIGPAMGAIVLAYELARAIADNRGCECLCSFAEKAQDARGREHFVLKRTRLRPGEQVLVIEDVITTAESANRTASAILDAGGQVLPFYAALVNRSGINVTQGRKLVALIDRPMSSWLPGPDYCPLCAQGSEALRPKGRENWDRLNAF